MRLLSYLIGGLLLANIAVYLWPQPVNTMRAVGNVNVDINPQYIRLNKDAVVDDDEILPMVTNNVIKSNVSKDSKRMEVINNREQKKFCYRLGPFTHQANFDLAQATLVSANIGFKESKRSAKMADAYRIYLGPFQNRSAFLKARDQVKREQLDYSVRKIAGQEGAISLGVYSTQAMAQSALGDFKKKWLDVKISKEQLMLPDVYWLHLSLSEDRVNEYKLLPTDWGEQSVSLDKDQCELMVNAVKKIPK